MHVLEDVLFTADEQVSWLGGSGGLPVLDSQLGVEGAVVAQEAAGFAAYEVYLLILVDGAVYDLIVLLFAALSSRFGGRSARSAFR